MKTNNGKSVLVKAANNFNDTLLAASVQQKERMQTEQISTKELSEFAKTLMQAIEIHQALDPSETGDHTLHIVMDQEEYSH